MQLLTTYPSQAAKRADYFSGASQREIADVDDDGELISRPERILSTEIEVPYEGIVCVSETTIRYWGSLMGLYDAVAVRRLVGERDDALAENKALHAELIAKNRLVDELTDALESTRVVYVDEAGNELATEAAAKRSAPSTPEPMPIDTEVEPAPQEAPG